MISSRWLVRLRARILYVVLCALCIFAALLPLHIGSAQWPRPDLMLAVTLAWAIRRPEDLPVLLVAVVFLLSDLLLMRPPGLWAALVLVAVNMLRQRQRQMKSIPFPAEWLSLVPIVLLLATAYWCIQTLLFVEQPPYHVQILRAGMTILVYPAVVAMLHYGLNVRKLPVPEGFGRRIQT